jgi:hypothetical protein
VPHPSFFCLGGVFEGTTKNPHPSKIGLGGAPALEQQYASGARLTLKGPLLRGIQFGSSRQRRRELSPAIYRGVWDVIYRQVPLGTTELVRVGTILSRPYGTCMSMFKPTCDTSTKP